MATNWLQVGLTAGAVYTVVLVAFAVPRRWTWAAMGVALANFAFVLLHLVAPFRGLLDPAYAGYQAGVLRLAPGPGVTLVTGAIVIAALASGGSNGAHGVMVAAEISQYQGVYMQLFWIGLIFGVAYLVLAPAINKLMHGVK